MIMTTNESPSFRRTFNVRGDAAARRASAVRIAQLIVNDPVIVDTHKREMLSVAIWKMTEADGGKLGCRFRSRGVLEPKVATIQHEHVIPRRELIQQLRTHPEHCESILNSAEGCLVTMEEHARLSAVDQSAYGWTRYSRAGVEVFDMSSDPPTPWKPWANDSTRELSSPTTVGGSEDHQLVAIIELAATDVRPGDVLVYCNQAHEVQKVRVLTKWVQYTEPDDQIIYRRVTATVRIKARN
jgi:hypothetical protein